MPAHPNFENTTTLADTTEDSATAALFRSAIGPVNTTYYLGRFTRFDAADHTSASWNWGAALLTLNWMVYRQLWGAALVYGGLVVGLGLLLLGIGRLVLQIPPETEIGLALALLLATVLLPGLYGNALYYTQCRKRMAHALVSHDTLPEACAMLLRQASSRQRLAWLALANAVVLGLVVAAALHFPKTLRLPEGPLTPIAPVAAIAPVKPITVPDLVIPPLVAASAPATVASAPAPVASAPLNMRPESTDKMVEPAPLPTPVPPVVKPAIKPPVKPAAKPAEKPAAKTAPAPAPASVAAQHFYVNVGLFADDNNARNAYVKLNDAGLPAAQTVLNTKKGPMTRVRVGPFDSEHEAERASDRVRALGLDAQITKP